MAPATTAPSEALRRYAAASLPRYTSCPTAPHFGPVAEGAYRGWLGEAGPEHALPLYVHVPFCRSLCWHCGCHTAAATRAAALPAPRGGTTALHFGGGTPSGLGAGALRGLVGLLRAELGLRPDAEIAAELDPRRTSRPRCRRASAGPSPPSSWPGRSRASAPPASPGSTWI